MSHVTESHGRPLNWSCECLSIVDSFAPEVGTLDACEFCRRLFARSGSPSSNTGGRPVLSDADMAERKVHLEEAHHFRKCAVHHFSNLDRGRATEDQAIVDAIRLLDGGRSATWRRAR